MNKILKTAGTIALKILKFVLENIMYIAVLYAVFKGEMVGAFLIAFMAIGLEIGDLKKHIEKSTDEKIMEEAETLVNAAFAQIKAEQKNKETTDE